MNEWRKEGRKEGKEGEMKISDCGASVENGYCEGQSKAAIASRQASKAPSFIGFAAVG